MTRRVLAVVSGAVVVMLLALPASAQTAGDVSPTCIGRTGAITVTAGMRILPAALEVQVIIDNQGTGAVRFEPSNAVLRTTEGAIASWTADQTKRAHRDYSTYILAAILIGPLGLLVTGASQWNFTRYVDSRAFHPVDVAARGAVRGSLFFPLPAKMGTRVALELSGLMPTPGDTSRQMRIYCVLPRLGANDHDSATEARERVDNRGQDESVTAAVNNPVTVQPVTVAPPPVTVTLLARGSAGPAEVVVTLVEFDTGYTAVELTVANRGAAEADVFAALANTMLISSGAAHPVRIAQSEFADRIPPENRATARLVFDPLPPPPQTSVASMELPGIRYGMDTVDVKVELRF